MIPDGRKNRSRNQSENRDHQRGTDRIFSIDTIENRNREFKLFPDEGPDENDLPDAC